MTATLPTKWPARPLLLAACRAHADPPLFAIATTPLPLKTVEAPRTAFPPCPSMPDGLAEGSTPLDAVLATRPFEIVLLVWMRAAPPPAACTSRPNAPGLDVPMPTLPPLSWIITVPDDAADRIYQ